MKIWNINKINSFYNRARKGDKEAEKRLESYAKRQIKELNKRISNFKDSNKDIPAIFKTLERDLSHFGMRENGIGKLDFGYYETSDVKYLTLRLNKFFELKQSTVEGSEEYAREKYNKLVEGSIRHGDVRQNIIRRFDNMNSSQLDTFFKIISEDVIRELIKYAYDSDELFEEIGLLVANDYLNENNIEEFIDKLINDIDLKIMKEEDMIESYLNVLNEYF